jgi:hypothetical protein
VTEPFAEYDAPAPSPLAAGPIPDLDGATSTGHPRVDAALAALANVADEPPVQQIAPLTDAHHVLRETLDSIGDV